ncbi:hypothetical protein A2394_02470 [Candidatus Woesebacteria bacterium RIFOXYB1_FULL_42_36]|uniref:Uncharacterized protein n=3 Tax=Candidatus Woeseibacteriota TaxID=1752722 RepID=A0A1F8DGG4_9BACT|nr:MAG: hypothetical protein A2394_02470 [Candidatus Woesebacteria bacterium RIFOXYB1_FULL_42_36]OGM84587.1 MAG: hypothetical protein A2421_00765 [Candidatus Woesebacteria bacterium RIFOXYC1_FULL_43_18]OGM87693.1 MAG: hypothetical protein A2573_00280 [Candidatus Woesebacteria bacterium RIFOXYD1_FULL_43_18]
MMFFDFAKGGRMTEQEVLIAYIIFVIVFWHFFNSKFPKTIWANLKTQGGKMQKDWPVVVMFASLIVGFILDRYGKTLSGLLIMVIGVVLIWIWALWPEIRNWFKNQAKHL